MRAIIDAAFSRASTVTLLLVLILAVGAYAYISIPKESTPEIPIPQVYVYTGIEGISPSDSERLLVEPLETELSGLQGLKSIKADAAEGSASINLEFEPGFDADEALDKVREAVDKAKPELPDSASDPTVVEINTALFPILTVVMAGPVPERTLIGLADDLKDKVEAVAGVLEVEVGGEREELLEVVVNPTTLETYNISFEQLVNQISRNNRLIAAGALDAGAGRLVLKVPGLIEDLTDVMDMPVKVDGDTVVRFRDVGQVRRTYRDPSGFARIGGQPALALEVKKRLGANVIETVDAVRAVIAKSQEAWPATLRIATLQDESRQVKTMLGDLQNNVIAAIVLVMIVIVGALGLRSAILVGIAIPGSFLAGVAVLWGLGYTLNMVVLFSLILVVGMLVDGAIVTVELADRRMTEGDSPREAYAHAAKRMAWPIIASTATTLAVFLPLLFWSGTVGEFMKFLPITVLFTLSASLFMALVFVPVLGGIIGRAQPLTREQKARQQAAETGDVMSIGGLTGLYVRALDWAVRRPSLTFMLAVTLLVAAAQAYGTFGRGVAFFPSVEPDFGQVQIRARDNFSIYERDALVRRVEERLFDVPELRSVYARTMNEAAARQLGEDVIGVIQIEYTDWDKRPPAARINDRIRKQVQDIAGIDVQVEVASGGPAAGKPINLRLIGRDSAALAAAVPVVRAAMTRVGGFTDITDTRPLPGVEWQLDVNRAEAAKFGADVTLIGQAVQLLTQGIEIAEYRPDDAEGSVDIRVRFPASDRTLEELQNLRIPTSKGQVPIRNFVTFKPAPRTGTIKRIDGQRVLSVEADVAQGRLADDQVRMLTAELATTELPEGVTYEFAGEAQEQADAMTFLVGAFGTAIFLMFTILVTQFNSFYQAFLVLSAIVFSVAGVLLGLLVTGRPFGVVMGGIGVIALAGIVVNNNIVLIDTYNDLRRGNDLRRAGMAPIEAALRTGAQRLRPVLLTSLTTVLGLLPMVFGMNIDFASRAITFGAPSTQYWTELSSAIAGGLVVATLLTLVLTPAMLMMGENVAAWRRRRRERRGARQAVPAAG